MRIAAAWLLAAACSPIMPDGPPAAVFTFGSLRGEARWIGMPENRPDIRLTILNECEAPAYWRGTPACAGEKWSQAPRDAQGRIWYGDDIGRFGCTFEDDTPFPSPNPAIWRIKPGAWRELIVQPFRERGAGPADGFASWEYEIGICLPSDHPPAHALDYRSGRLRLRWSRGEGLSVNVVK